MPDNIGTIHIVGFREFQRALKDSESVIRAGFRDALREAVEPVERQAEVLALVEIPRMTLRSGWWEMRTGVTQKMVYIVPRMKGTNRPARKRKNLADKLLNEAMTPAFDQNIDHITDHVLSLYDEAVTAYARG